jgi:hypothetical protein
VRVVKSQKDRAWDNMKEGILRIKNSKKTNDWSVIQDEFDKVNKMIEKSRMLIMKNGLPLFYTRMLGELEDYLNETLQDKENVKKMKPAVKKALDRMKLTLKKHNKGYEKEIADFRANPDKYVEEEASEVCVCGEQELFHRHVDSCIYREATPMRTLTKILTRIPTRIPMKSLKKIRMRSRKTCPNPKPR